jgi:DNA repair protein RadC
MKKDRLLSEAGVSEIELVYKSKVKYSEQPKIRTSNDIYSLLMNVWDDNKIDFVEQFKVVLLNRANMVIGVVDISSGGVTGTVADPKIILAAAIKSNSVNIVLSHNHPSGNVTPSKADEELTCKIKEAAKFHDLKVLDHLIITRESYYSFADEGLM